MRRDEFQAALLDWFDRLGRKNLPWQIDSTPYKVWVSEIMLQQTQVVTATPYFLRFINRFPDVESLARCEDSEVLGRWAGLGYYARARNLHRSAQIILDRHGGELPTSLDDLLALPGIGRSTAGAILSLGHGIRAPILDGNVKRVLSRFAGVAGWPGASDTAKELWALSEHYTPASRAGDYNQAIMDLGASVCSRRRPACGECPLQRHCVACRDGLTDAIPGTRPTRPLPVKRCFLLALRNHEGEYLLQRRPPVGIWGGLLSLPEFASEADLAEFCNSWITDGDHIEYLPERRHTFTHFHLDYRPVLGLATLIQQVAETSAGQWFKPESDLALPAPVRSLLAELSLRDR